MADSITTGKPRFILGFGLFFIALFFLWNTVLVYPLKIFVVLLHEVSHALAVLVTGGTVHAITLDPYEGGATHFTGGSELLALNAGYLGSLAWGALLFTTARARRIPSEWVNGLIGASVVLLTAVYVRNGFGIAFGIVFGLAMIFASRKMSRTMNRRLLWALGLTSALYAILDIKSDVLDRPGLRSDAAVLAEMIGVPTVFVGSVWIAVAIAFSAWLVAKAYSEA